MKDITIQTENAPISSITAGPRQSNIELLRIFAMFLVLVVHADFWSTGFPSSEDMIHNPVATTVKTFIESISVVCVNVFVMISGWFGIRPTAKGFCNFLFQCAYFLIGIYVVLLLTGQTTFSMKGVLGCLCLTDANWFIRAYAALYIISPILNTYIENTNSVNLRNTLIFFFVFQSIWGWSGAAKFVEGGYSTFSFIGLYLLARYVRLYCRNSVTRWGGVIYMTTIVLNTVWFLMGHEGAYQYCNPLVILGSLGLLLFFNNLKINSNKIINWVAKSAFAVFLLHTNPNIGIPYFQKYVKILYNEHSGIDCLFMILILLILIYLLAIILDQPRKYLWNKYLAKKFA